MERRAAAHKARHGHATLLEPCMATRVAGMSRQKGSDGTHTGRSLATRTYPRPLGPQLPVTSPTTPIALSERDLGLFFCCWSD